MHEEILTTTVAAIDSDENTKVLLREINEKLGILIDLQQARQPPKEAQPEQTDYSPAESDKIDTSWIDPKRWYDNSQFCRMLNVALVTAQKWRSKRLIDYFKLGRNVRYYGHEIIRFINVYATPRNYVITQISEDDSEE